MRGLSANVESDKSTFADRGFKMQEIHRAARTFWAGASQRSAAAEAACRCRSMFSVECSLEHPSIAQIRRLAPIGP